MSYIEFLTLWCASLTDFLADHGIELRSGATSDDRSKPSAWVTLSKGDLEAELLVWSTGEAEYASGGASVELIQTHYDFASTADMTAVLAQVLRAVSHD